MTWSYLTFPLIGFIGMLCGGFWSVGCGWLIVPTMLIFGFGPLEAVGAALCQMVLSTAPTVLKELKKTSWQRPSVLPNLALPMALGVVMTAFSGRLINTYLEKRFGSFALLCIFVFVMTFIGLKSIFGKTAVNQEQMPEIKPLHSLIALFCGMFTGVISSVLGISGALIFRPTLINGFKVPEKQASQATRFLLLTASFTSAMFYLFAGAEFHHNILFLGALIALGGAFGFPLGVKYGAIVVKNGYVKILQKSFGSIVFIIITNSILNLLGYISFSRYLMISCAVVLFLTINAFTFFARKYPRRLFLKNKQSRANN